jgi:hypothetical protein
MFGVALAAVALAACTTIGVGEGKLLPGDTPVQFDWSSSDGGISGVMSARLGTGSSFEGPFLQVTQQEVTQAQPDASVPAWDAWDGDAIYPETGMTTLYSGRVEANLASADGQRMQCRFTLTRPAAGMKGGGQGECQLGGGRTVDAVLRHG